MAISTKSKPNQRCIGAEICCETSGDCFTTDPPFGGAAWPLPYCHEAVYSLWRKDMNGSSLIYRGHTPQEYKVSDPTVYLVHGWTSNGSYVQNWVYDVKDEFLLNQMYYNIIIVEWREGSDPVYYPQAASNTRTAGSELADINEQLNGDYTWCVGHSLGSHVCGHAGKFEANFDRITGLDPAGPNFDLPECTEFQEVCRLVPADANQVDVIHTDIRGSGTLNLLGHIDFFPNEGIGLQPGCDDESCGHNIAHEYFRVSVNNDCFISTHHRCNDVLDLPDSCLLCGPEECPNMGLSTSFGEGVYYLETNPEEPYCQG